ncbi:Tripeptidyl aminopeptidase precursor [Actinomyces howellii]|uniref:Tripeptidyl aminopeptidase n=1 Tax=Actinomyces howellii TaxID=52771 RepID=A0A448HGF4_9ACTO|nr:Tripeptidyl aminopeptidase precursor [Actinomyces howellii]
MNRATRTLSIVTATACLLLSSCTAGTTTSAPSSAVPVDAPSAPPVPAGLESYYSQKVDWAPCEDDASFECATVTVPLDYDDPSGQTIDLALKKLPSTSGNPIGTLLTNPGGPGGSGVDYVSQEGVFSDALRSAYDIIGFDPRGVGKSTPLTCLSPQEISDTVAAELEASGAGAAQDPADAAQTEEPSEVAGEETADSTEQTAAELASKCEQNSPVPGIIDHMDTASVARDMDVLRGLSGDNRLYYLGVSYGTYLGARYAEMFPSHVGRMVLDSAQDPSRENAENVVEQAEAIERSLHAYVEHCQSGKDCPLTGDTEAGVAQIKELIDKASTSPLPVTIGQPVDGATLTRALIDLMYDNSVWDLLTGALRQAIRDNDGTGLAVLADPDLLDDTTDPQELAEQEAAETANENAISAVDCLDYPVRGDSAQWEAQAERIKEVAPTLGTGLAFPDAFCQGWGHHGDHEPGQIRATGAAPILVIGITGDPLPVGAGSRLSARLGPPRHRRGPRARRLRAQGRVRGQRSRPLPAARRAAGQRPDLHGGGRAGRGLTAPARPAAGTSEPS